MTKTPTMSVRFDKRADFVGGAGDCRQASACGGSRSFVLYRARRRCDQGVRTQGPEAAGVNCAPLIDRTRPTTHKNAFMARRYRLLKFDTLDNRSISERHPEHASPNKSQRHRPTSSSSATSATAFSTAKPSGTLIEAIPARKLPRCRQPGGQPVGQYPRIQRLRPDHAERARGALRAGRPGFGVRPLGWSFIDAVQVQDLILKLGERGLMTFRACPSETRMCGPFSSSTACRARHRRCRLRRCAACLCDAGAVRNQEQRYCVSARRARSRH